MSAEPTNAVARLRPCPLCGKPAKADYKPFCSKGCRDRDFLQWTGEGYKLPGSLLEDDALGQIEKNATNGLDSEADD